MPELDDKKLNFIADLLSGKFGGLKVTFIILGLVALYLLLKYTKLATHLDILVTKSIDKLFNRNSLTHDLDNCLNSLYTNYAEVKNIKTGDFVKDKILYDFSKCIAETTKDLVQEFIDKTLKTCKSKEDVAKKIYMLEQNIVNVYHEKLLNTYKIPKVVLDKANEIMKKEEDFFRDGLNNFIDNIHYNNTKLVAGIYLGFVCSIFSTIITNFKEQIVEMNGDLYGLSYNDLVVGMYDSNKFIKCKKLPLPFKVTEEQVKDALQESLELAKSDLVCLFDFFEAEKKDTYESIEENLGILLTSDVGITYASDANLINYENYIKLDSHSLLNHMDLKKLIDNQSLCYDIMSLDTWTFLKTFMTEFKFKQIFIQPILYKKNKMIGIICFFWKEPINKTFENKLTIELKKQAPALVKLFRYN